MIVTAEIAVNPGPKALFVAEVKVEKNANVSSKWWGLWFGWWLYRLEFWQEWLWQWETINESGYRWWQVRIFGFEIVWQRRRYVG